MQQKNISASTKHKSCLATMDPTSLYDSDRVKKISVIMPNFAQVAEVGDEVATGLVGDPLYREATRFVGNIEKIQQGEGEEKLISIRDSASGQVKTFSSQSIKPNEVWEFTDSGFKNVLERERRAQEMRAESELKAENAKKDYRGLFGKSSQDKVIDDLRAELSLLKTKMEEDRKTTQSFNNTVISSMHEMASDICKLDVTGEKAEFCKIFNTQFDEMKRMRSESSFRGKSRADSVVSSSSSYTKHKDESPILFSDEDDSMSDSDLSD